MCHPLLYCFVVCVLFVCCFYCFSLCLIYNSVPVGATNEESQTLSFSFLVRLLAACIGLVFLDEESADEIVVDLFAVAVNLLNAFHSFLGMRMLPLLLEVIFRDLHLKTGPHWCGKLMTFLTLRIISFELVCESHFQLEVIFEHEQSICLCGMFSLAACAACSSASIVGRCSSF